jgi:ATP-dependent DNA ligase
MAYTSTVGLTILMKFKDFSDTEATIIGYELGKGKRTGTLGKFIMQDDEGNSSVVHRAKAIPTRI